MHIWLAKDSLVLCRGLSDWFNFLSPLIPPERTGGPAHVSQTIATGLDHINGFSDLGIARNRPGRQRLSHLRQSNSNPRESEFYFLNRRPVESYRVRHDSGVRCQASIRPDLDVHERY